MTKHRKYILKIVTWLFLALFVLIVLSGTFVFITAERYINKHLSEWISKKSNHLYELSFKSINLKLQPLSLSIEDVSLTTNQEVARQILEKSPEKVLYNFHSPKILINRINLQSFVRKKIFRCKSINVYKPELKLEGAEILQQDSALVVDRLFYELQPLFKDQLKSVAIDEINFVNANYKIYTSSANLKQISNAENISVVIRKFRTDSTLIFDKARFFNSDDILIEMNNFKNDLGDSLHILNIDTLEYSLKTANISAFGFHLNYLIKDSTRNLYDVFVPKVVLKSKSLVQLSISDSLEIQYLEFQNPEIRFYNKENRRKIKVQDISQFNLYPLVKNQFSYFKVDSFFLKNAILNIFRQPDTEQLQQQFQSFNVELYDFLLDSASSFDKDRLLHARDLEMNVQGYRLRLEDNYHEFYADSIFVSTINNSLGTKNIRISPLTAQQQKSHTQVNIECKELSVADADLKTIYHTRTFPDRLIKILEPKVKIQYLSQIKKNKKQKEAGLLFDLVSAYLKGVYSKVVQVENGELKIENLYNSHVQGYFETNFNFTLSGFALDSASINRTDKFFYASNFDIQFTDYRMRLVDDLHRIKVDRISILSSDRKLQVQNLLLEPVVSNIDQSVAENYSRSELYKIKIPEIELTNVNLREAFFHNKLDAEQFQITNPDIYFENFGTLRRKKEKSEFTEFYQLIFNYISDFNIRNIIIPNGEFTWTNHTKKGKTISFDNQFAVTMENFRLNENEVKKQRIFFSDNFNISLKDQVFMLSDSVHILQAGQINISSKESLVDIKDAFLYPDMKSKNYNRLSTTFQISVPTLHLHNINFEEAYFSKEISLEKLEVDAPKFRIFTRSGIAKSLDLNKFQIPLPPVLNSLELRELELKNGQVITYETSGEKQKVKSNFNIDMILPGVSIKTDKNKQVKLSTSNLIAKISRFETLLGTYHKFSIQQLDFNKKQKTLVVSGLNIEPFAQKNIGNKFAVAAPQITFSGFDVQQALDKNFFIFDEITLSNPKIAIEITDSIKGDKLEFTKNLDLYSFIEPYTDKLEINRLNLNNVDLNFNWFTKQLIDRRFNIDFKEINIAENLPSKNLLHAKEFEISTTNFSKKTKNGMYEFTADSLIYNSEKHNAILTNIEVKPLLSVEEFNRRSIFQADYVLSKTDYIELKGINESLWLQKKILDADKLVIGNTDLNVFRNKRYPFNEKQRPPWPQDLLKNIKQQFVFDSVILKPSRVIYSELSDLSDERGSVSFNNLQLKAGTLSNMQNIISKAPYFKADASTDLMNQAKLSVNFNFDLSSKNYQHSVKGSLQPVSMKPFNSIIQKASPIQIESGQIDKFDFDISLDNNLATGEVYFGFHDFKINVMNMESSEAKKSKLATFWANHMIFNSQNPKGNDELQPEKISYERDVQRSVINYWWKAILEGSKPSLGIKARKTDALQTIVFYLGLFI